MALLDVTAVEKAVAALAKYINAEQSIPQPRAAMLEVDYIMTTITDAVFVFSELESLLAPFKNPVLMKDNLLELLNLVYAMHSSKIDKLLKRIQWHKATLMLIFSTIQWFNNPRSCTYLGS